MITLSPKNKAAPIVPRIVTIHLVLGFLPIFLINKAVNANTPPSPWLSARIIIKTYLMLTTIIKDQVIKDKTPKTELTVPVPLSLAASTDSLRA